MKDYIITVESTIDLNTDLVKKYNIKYIDNIYYLNEEEYFDNIKDGRQAEKFYNLLKEGKDPKTTQINSNRFYEFFLKFVKNNKDIIHLSFSSGLSGTYHQAVLAGELIKEDYPNSNIIIIDTLAASSGYGLLFTKAYEYKEDGLNIYELENKLNEIKLNLNHWFYSTDLTYFIKGGRVTKAEGFIGKTLNICPILNVNDEGKLIPRHKVIGKKRVINKMLNIINNNILNKNDYNDYIYISHSNMLDDVVSIKDKLVETYPNIKDIIINDIGPLVGSHTGEGTVAIFFFGEMRER